MSGHTPGPWTVEPRRTSISIIAGGRTVSTSRLSYDPDDRREEKEANARLMAASPDLLALAKWAIANEGECLGDHPAKLREFKAAIAKAEGSPVEPFDLRKGGPIDRAVDAVIEEMDKERGPFGPGRMA